jgi:[ribosomal protein S5]-alanine N-acetyltransferase
MSFSLIRCGIDGLPVVPISLVSDAIRSTYAATADLYRRVGFVEPWVSYIAVNSGQAVGGGAFVGSPRENRVEIAYFTLPEFEERSYATQTATELIAIARGTIPSIVITALTLPEQNASTTILRRLGFSLFGNARDPDAGDVWEWRT